MSLGISQAYEDHSSLDSLCVHLLQVDGQILFVCPNEVVKEEPIVLEACWDEAWSNPFVLSLMAAMVPDNLDSMMADRPTPRRQEFEEPLAAMVPDDLDSIMAGSPAPQRQEFEERLAGFLGEQHGPLGFPTTSVLTAAA